MPFTNPFRSAMLDAISMKGVNMARQNKRQKLAALLEAQRQLEEKIKSTSAEVKTDERKNDTRRKVIVGALAYEHMTKNPDSDFAKVLLRLMDEYVVREDSRSLFPELPALAPDRKADAAQAAPRRRLVNRAKEAAAEVLKAPEGGADEAEAAAS